MVVNPFLGLWRCMEGQLEVGMSCLSLLHPQHSAGALCGSLWGFGSSLRLALFPFLALSLVACSLTNYIVLKIIILHLSSCFYHLTNCYLENCHLAPNLWLLLLFVVVGRYVWLNNAEH